MPKDIDKYFYNRKKDISKINSYLNMLELDIPNQLLITGYRGVGKTSLLKKVLKNQSKNLLTTYVDLSDIFGREQGKLTEEEVLKLLLTNIKEVLQERQDILDNTKDQIIISFKQLKLKNYSFNNNASIFDISIPQIEDNYVELSKFVMELPQKIVDSNDDINGFIIVIDEFQLLKTLKNPEAFFWMIRSYTQKQFNVTYIFTGSVSRTAEVIEMINGQTGAFGGRMIQIDIDPFSKEETKSYVLERSNGITFTKNGFERFYKCTRGIPAYINSLCNILPDNQECDEELIKETLLLNIDQVAIMWLYNWGRLSSIEKEIILLLLKYENLNWTKLLDLTDYSRATLTKYIDSLSNKGIIEYTIDKQYKIVDNMLKMWLKIKYNNEGKYPL